MKGSGPANKLVNTYLDIVVAYWDPYTPGASPSMTA